MKASSFFVELKRRKVYRVAAAYAVVSWLLIQAASIFLPTFDAPPCMMKAIVVFLALGFILSAILSWIFDITPQGIKRTADISPNERLTSFGSLRRRPGKNSSAVICPRSFTQDWATKPKRLITFNTNTSITTTPILQADQWMLCSMECEAIRASKRCCRGRSKSQLDRD